MVSPSGLGSTETLITLNGKIGLKHLISIFYHKFILFMNFLKEEIKRLILSYGFGQAPGTNNAPKDQSAVIIAKIAQIKFVEILNEEYEDLIPVIVGPGWVNTKTHNEVLSIGPSAGYKYFQTKERIESGNFTSMEKIMDFFDWIIKKEKKAVGGRNFSIRSDIWEKEILLLNFLMKKKMLLNFEDT